MHRRNKIVLVPQYTRRVAGQIAGLLGLGVATLPFGPTACRKADPVSRPSNIGAVEHNVLQALQIIQANRMLNEVSFMGKRLRVGTDDLGRIFNAELVKAGSKKRVYFEKDAGHPAQFIFGKVSEHSVIDNIDVFVFDENEVVTTLGIHGRSHNLWNVSAIRMKGCDSVWSNFGLRAFRNRDPFAIAVLKFYGVQKPSDLSVKRKQAVEDLAECVKHHELVHQKRRYLAVGDLAWIKFGRGRNNLIILMETRADLGVLNHIVNMKDKEKAVRLALLWTLNNYFYGIRIPSKAIVCLVLLSAIKTDPQTGKITIDFSRLRSITEKVAKKLDETISSIEGKVKKKITKSLSASQIEAEKRRLRAEFNSAKYPLAGEKWFRDGYIWGKLFKRFATGNPEVNRYARAVIEDGAISVVRELINLPEISDRSLSHDNLLHSVQVLINEKLASLNLQ
jgi:hypothetical protein